MDARQHALGEIALLYEQSAKRVEAAESILQVSKKRVEVIFTLGLLSALGTGLAFIVRAPWFFFGFFFCMSILWTLHSVFHYLMARRAMLVGFMQGAHKEMGIWKDAVEKAKG